MRFPGFILTRLLGWKMVGEFPDVPKSIVIFAPHTSYYDAFFGKLYFLELGIKHHFLSKKELFFFPMNILLKWYGSIPVRGVMGRNAIYDVAKMLNSSDSLHVILSPEGAFAKVTKWDKGFIYMSFKSNVPIVVGYLDYKKKEVGVKGVIESAEDVNSVMAQVNEMYSGVTAKHPENFSTNLSK